MLDTLKFVQGAVAKKDFVPVLTHFRIEDGRITGCNGTLTLSSPIDLNLTVSPSAAKFTTAIKACSSETISISVTASNKLSIKSGRYRALVPCTEEVFPEAHPTGDRIDAPEDFLETVKLLAPFVGIDASRPWATGILFHGKSAYATNNIIFIERWLGCPFPATVNIPKAAIKELLRINKNPTHIQMDSDSITFHFEGERWLKAQAGDLAWPDPTPFLEKPYSFAPVPEGFFEAIEVILPDAGDTSTIYLNDEFISTTNDNDEVGAQVGVPGLNASGIFNGKQFLSLQHVVTAIDLSCYPAPLGFVGDNLRGVIIGKRG